MEDSCLQAITFHTIDRGQTPSSLGYTLLITPLTRLFPEISSVSYMSVPLTKFGEFPVVPLELGYRLKSVTWNRILNIAITILDETRESLVSHYESPVGRVCMWGLHTNYRCRGVILQVSCLRQSIRRGVRIITPNASLPKSSYARTGVDNLWSSFPCLVSSCFLGHAVWDTRGVQGATLTRPTIVWSQRTMNAKFLKPGNGLRSGFVNQHNHRDSTLSMSRLLFQVTPLVRSHSGATYRTVDSSWFRDQWLVERLLWHSDIVSSTWDIWFIQDDRGSWGLVPPEELVYYSVEEIATKGS